MVHTAAANAAHSPHSLHHSSWPVSLSPLTHSSATVLPNASPLASDNGFGGISHLLGYVDDDIFACVYLHNLPLLCTTLQQSSWLSSCLFPTRRRRPTPPNNAAHTPIAPRRGGVISPTYHMDVLPSCRSDAFRAVGGSRLPMTPPRSIGHRQNADRPPLRRTPSQPKGEHPGPCCHRC